MKDETLVVFGEYNTLMEAEITKSVLESAGIEASINNEYMSSIYPTGVMPASVIIRESDLEAARALVNNR